MEYIEREESDGEYDEVGMKYEPVINCWSPFDKKKLYSS